MTGPLALRSLSDNTPVERLRASLETSRREGRDFAEAWDLALHAAFADGVKQAGDWRVAISWSRTRFRSAYLGVGDLGPTLFR